MIKYILASASPRRKEILENAGYKFSIFKSDIDENIGVDDPQLLVRELSVLKACDIGRRLDFDCIVIGADTVVSIDGEILGKPKDEEDAFLMLKKLSGRQHSVFTGVCVLNKYTGIVISKCDETKIRFRSITDNQIRDYIKTGEPFDKAGSYAIQGEAAKFVLETDGEFDNVVGFPVKLFEELLEESKG